LLGQVQKLHCSLVDQRKGLLKGRLATRREILWWKNYAKLARESGRLPASKLLIINKLTHWRGGEFELSIEALQAIELKRFRVRTILCSGVVSEAPVTDH
jgi:hypothetical protein